MSNDIILREENRTIQQVGGNSKALIIPSEIATGLGLEVSNVCTVRWYVKYQKDKQGNIICDKDGQPKIEKSWGTYWKKGE
jgi:hypothetical protein